MRSFLCLNMREIWKEEDVRTVHPELTRCVVCGVLDDQTQRVVLENDVLTVWLHERCLKKFKPTKLSWGWPRKTKRRQIAGQWVEYEELLSVAMVFRMKGLRK